MSIYADKDIVEAIEEDRIVVSPPIRGEQVQPASLDLRMGERIVDVATGRRVPVTDDKVRIQPWRFYLGETLESISLPKNVRAKIENRSTFAREGMIPHLAAGKVDPGWEGRLTLEMFNFSTTPVEIGLGERVVQLEFAETMSVSEGYGGKYQGAKGLEGSKRE